MCGTRLRSRLPSRGPARAGSRLTVHERQPAAASIGCTLPGFPRLGRSATLTQSETPQRRGMTCPNCRSENEAGECGGPLAAGTASPVDEKS